MSLRKYLFEIQRGKCHYCDTQMTKRPYGKYFATEDHIIPKSKGGSGMVSNLVGACFTCNNMRGTIPYPQFKLYIHLHGNKQPIGNVLRSLTREQYEQNRTLYDAVRREHHETHLPVSDRRPLPRLFDAPSMPIPAPPPAPTVTYRRNYLHITRRTIESILIGIPFRKRQQILMEITANDDTQGKDNDGRYLGNDCG